MSAAAVHRPLLVAVVGDSISDEYEYSGPPVVRASATPLIVTDPVDTGVVGLNSARNWVENLAATRKGQISFGDFSETSRSSTRDQGFAENWASIGAAAIGGSNSLAVQLAGDPSKSLPGLLTQTKADSGHRLQDVDAVVIEIGINDYLKAFLGDVMSGGATAPFVRPAGARVDPVNAEIEGAIASTVDQIHQSMPRARVVLVAPPDLGSKPQIKAAIDSLGDRMPGVAAQITQSTAELKSDLASYARWQGLGLVDEGEVLDRSKVGGVSVGLQSSGQDLTNGFVDNFHPGTVLQGVLAQKIVAAINGQFHRDAIKPVSDAEVAAYAKAVQPGVTLTRSASPAGAGVSTLKATVAAGRRGAAMPTGSVTFQTIVPASPYTVAHFGTALGVVPLNASGVATLDIADDVLAGTEVVAVYGGDPGNVTRVSHGVVAPGATVPFTP